MTKKSSLADGYIHGFSKSEQDRLYHQARVHEDVIFSNLDFSECKKIVEIGSGVGAQTQILLERYPDVTIDCVDASKDQLARAAETHATAISAGRVRLNNADAIHMPFQDNAFDGAFICWLLEHVQNPIDLLSEARRVLKSGGVIYCNEVLNATFYLHPYSPATLKFWFEFNDQQWALKGDPFVGGKLANFLIKSGFQNISTKVLTHQYDSRMPKKRSAFIDYWTDLLLSGAPSLIQSGRISEQLVLDMQAELSALKNDPDAVIFYSWILARAEAY